MSFSILPVEDADFPRVSDVVCDSIADDEPHEYIEATWPGYRTRAGRERAHSRLQFLSHNLSESSSFLKAVDDRSGSIVGCCIALHNPTPPTQYPGLPDDTWDNGKDREYGQRLRKERNELLLRVMIGFDGAVAELGLLFVDPAAQRLGVGRAFLSFLRDRYSSHGVPIVVVANPNAEGFYRKVGFVTREDEVLPLEQKWADKPQARLLVMTYEKQMDCAR